MHHYKKYQSILSPQNGMNIYRGCTHGCIYCDSRSHCYQMQHDFEDVEVKLGAKEMLEDALKRKRKKVMIGTGAMGDPYIPLEAELKHTRGCLEVIEKYGFGLAIQTKSCLIGRDLDLLKAIHKKSKCVVQMTLTTYDEALCKIIEPNVSSTRERFEILKILRDEGIPTVVWLNPFLPFINDTRENLSGLLDMCVTAEVKGVLCFGIGLTLRAGNREYFYRQLDKHFPTLKKKYEETYGHAYVCNSKNHKSLMAMLESTCKAHGILYKPKEVFDYLHAYEEKNQEIQLSFWD